MANATFSATKLVAQYYDRTSRYSTDAAFQGARWRDTYTVEMVGVIVIPSLSSVSWANKVITAVNLTVNTRSLTKYDTIRLYRSRLSQYYDSPQRNGYEYLDTTGGYTEIAIGSTATGERTVALSAANIAWLQTQLRAGYVCFCIYYGGDRATSSVPQSEHFYGTSAFTLSITYEDAKSTIDSVSNADIGGTTTLRWTNYSANVTNKVRFTLGSADSGEIDASGSSHTFTLPSSWLQQLPTVTSGTATAYLYSYVNGTLIGTDTKTFTASVPASVKPSIGNMTVTKQNDNTTVALWDIWLQSYTKAVVALSNCAAGAGASIASYAITGQDLNYSAQTSAASVTATSGALSAGGDLTFTATITDTRGRTATRTVTVTVEEYSPPNISNLIGRRCDSSGTLDAATGTYIKAAMKYTFSAVGSNAMENKISYKKHTDAGYTVAVQNVNDWSWTAAFGGGNIEIASSYDVQGYIVDSLGNSATYTVIVSSVVGISFGLNNDRARFGGVVEKAGLTVDWETDLQGGVDVKDEFTLYTANGTPVNFYTSGGVFVADFRNNAGSVRMVGLFCDDQNGQMSFYNASNKQRNFVGVGRFACYDESGNETVRLSYDKKLMLGNTTLTEAKLQQLLALI